MIPRRFRRLHQRLTPGQFRRRQQRVLFRSLNRKPAPDSTSVDQNRALFGLLPEALSVRGIAARFR